MVHLTPEPLCERVAGHNEADVGKHWTRAGGGGSRSLAPGVV